MSTARISLKQFIQQNAEREGFLQKFKTLLEDYEVPLPDCITVIPSDDKKKKRKYPDKFEDLSREHLEKLAMIGFSRITKRRKNKKEDCTNEDESSQCQSSSDETN